MPQVGKLHQLLSVHKLSALHNMIGSHTSLRATMNVFHCLPVELKFEVLIHLDCRTLVTVLNLYSHLKDRVAIITDCTERDPYKMSIALQGMPTASPPTEIRSLLPGVRCVRLTEIPQALAPHTYLKIFEVASDIISAPDLTDYLWPQLYYKLDPSYGVAAYGKRFNEYNIVWPKLLSLMDRHSVISCFANRGGFDLVQGWLLQMSHLTGASYHPQFLPLDDLPDTPLPRATSITSAFSPWLRLSFIRAKVERDFRLDRMPQLETLSVEFTAPRGRGTAPIFEVNSAPQLITLRVLYHGDLVPWMSVKDSFHHTHKYSDLYIDPYCYSETTLELIRLHPERSLSVKSPEDAKLEKDAYKGDLSFLNRCVTVTFSGIPDWFVLTAASYTNTETLKWTRTDPTQIFQERTRAGPTLVMPTLETLHICSMLENDTLPFIQNTHKTVSRQKRSRYQDLTLLNLTIGAPGFQLNGLLSTRAIIYCLVIRSLCICVSKEPVLSLASHDMHMLESKCVAITGAIDLCEIQLPTGLDLFFDVIDLDLGTTARLSPDNVVDMAGFPLGSRDSIMKITCPINQPLKLALYRSKNPQTRALQIDEETGRYIFSNRERAALYLDWHIIHSTTFEGEPIVGREFTPSHNLANGLAYAHFLYDGESQNYVFCRYCDLCLTRYHHDKELESE